MNLKEALPCLAKQIEEGIVCRYDSSGSVKKLLKKQEKKIKELETEYEGTKVVAVLDTKYKYSFYGMHLNTYLLMSDDSIPEVTKPYTRYCVRFLAFVDNMDDPEYSEMGEVGVIEESGKLMRMY